MPHPAPAARPYRAIQLKAVMDSTGENARSWRDVLEYLEGQAERNDEFVRHEIPAMIDDVKHLERDRIRFTRDYRKMWQMLTGENAENLPPPAYADPRDLDPFELQQDYFEALAYPSVKKDILHAARVNGAPTRVMDRIEELEEKVYRNRDELLEAMKDADWNDSQRRA